MGLEIGTQLRLLGWRNRVLEQKLHLLPEPAADNDVVLIRFQRDCGLDVGTLAGGILPL
jgi:hypothetical protein